ncbi:ArnT family glycosyltransferase [Algirhabdus cladophorae]|uniref:ArnT family glycosyltransferase n=1 Tax=Algirhabdus cladophorae TaxID=3377108 RepID=UPI003B8489CB
MPNIRLWNWAIAFVLALTSLRVITLYFAQIDLFVDESQYWFWGQSPDFGYYSKPPLIGWVIRAVTDVAGSDSAFWVRLPAPILHGITALILGSIARRYVSVQAGLVVTVGYATLPLVVVGSTLISTDTIMFPFLAGALACYLRYFETDHRRWIVFAGGLLGCAAMAKYAGVYYILCACCAAVFLPRYRMQAPVWLSGLGAFLLVISPNVLWNFANGFSTAQHTLDNADWVRDPSENASINFPGLLEFLAAQLAVFGPVLFVVFVMLGCGFFRSYRPPYRSALLVFSIPIVLLVCMQAVLSQAYANWAAAAYLAASVVVLPVLLSHKYLLILSFAINGALSVLLPLAVVNADKFSIDGRSLVMARYVDIEKMSLDIFEVAEQNSQSLIVARNRDVLADMFYTLRDKPLIIRSTPPKARAANHYALSYPLVAPHPNETMLLVLHARKELPCVAEKVAEFQNNRGHYKDDVFIGYIAPSTCFDRR